MRIYLEEEEVIHLRRGSHTYLLLVLVCVTDVYTRTRFFPSLHLGFSCLLHIVYLYVGETGA